jgi:predicted ATPase
MLHLTEVRYRPAPSDPADRYPFSIPLIRSLGALTFDTPVTFLVGENGSGKSTLLEAIAVAARSVTVGAESVATDPTLGPARELARALRLSWVKRTHRGFFLRSEDFFSFCKSVAQLRVEMDQGLQETERAFADKSILARELATGVYRKSLGALERSYGKDLDANSHGESFLKLFEARFVPEGLYILDEPETPLSPTRQLAFIALMLEMVKQGCQFLIATHSPILMAFPGAAIVSLDHLPPRQVSYADLEHVRITREFLNNPDSFLRHLQS